MKIISTKQTETFYIPFYNDSCDSSVNYKVIVDDPYDILSIDATEGVNGTLNNYYFSVPPIPSFPIDNDTLVATCSNASGVNLYSIEIHVPNASKFLAYGIGANFYLFTSSGGSLSIPISLIGQNGEFPKFSIDQYSLIRLLNNNLPAPNTHVTISGGFKIARENTNKNYLKVVTNSKSEEDQTASVTLYVPGLASNFYEFNVKTVPSAITKISQPPTETFIEESVQMARAFIPVSGVQTLQVDSEGKLFIDKLHSSSVSAKPSFKRRCTNLGYAKDLAKFFNKTPKDSVFSFDVPSSKYSTSKYSEQYFTDVNSGVTKSSGTKEGMKSFAPLWLKGTLPKYYAIFRRPVTKKGGLPLDGASLVKLVNIQESELGKYLSELSSHPLYGRQPIEIDALSNYKVTWNGVSIESGEFTSHIEFLGSDIQSGLSDFELNELITTGFQRAGIICPQFLNIEFLFDDTQTKPFEVYQYFGLYCDTLDMGKFSIDIDTTSAIYNQDFSRVAYTNDTNDAVVSNATGVGLALMGSRTVEGRYQSVSVDYSSNNPTKYVATIAPESTFSKKMVLTIHPSFNPTTLKSVPFKARLENSNGELLEYIDIIECTYNSTTSVATLKASQNDVYSATGQECFVRFFDYTLSSGKIRFDSPVNSKSGCVILSTTDKEGKNTLKWVQQIVEQPMEYRQPLTLIDKSTHATLTLIPETLQESSQYVKIFYSILESNGEFSVDGIISVDSLSIGSSSVFPSKSLVESNGRKFVLKSKNGWHSIKSIDIQDSGDSALGLLKLDSTTVTLDGAAGIFANDSVPVQRIENYLPAIQLSTPTNGLNLNYGDKVIFERYISGKRKRWSVCITDTPWTGVVDIGGWTKEISVTSVSIENDYVSFVGSTNDVFPASDNLYTFIHNSTGLEYTLSFISAESLPNNQFRAYFSGSLPSGTYSKVRVEQVDTSAVATSINDGFLNFRDLVSSMQVFQDAPFRAAIISNNPCVRLTDKSGECSLQIIGQGYQKNSIKINGESVKPEQIIVNGAFISSQVTKRIFDDASNVYHIPTDKSALFAASVRLMPKSGNFVHVNSWSNGVYCIPDVFAQADGRQDGYVISLDSEPFILNGRVQIVEEAKTSIYLLSFLRYVDLNFFDELPYKQSPGLSTILQQQPLQSNLTGYAQPYNDYSYEYFNNTIINKNGLTKDASTKNMATSTSNPRGKSVPSVGRWKRSRSRNSDFRPYTLNVDPTQLEYDSFSGISYKTIEPDIFPLDFYVISGWPTMATSADENEYNYIGDRIDIDSLKSNEHDYFSDFLTVGEGTEKFRSGKSRGAENLWSIIEKRDNDLYSTMFKGLPLDFQSRIDIHGYKFAAILQIDDTITSSRKIDFIVNECWQFVALIVQIPLSGGFIDGSITFEELYNIMGNTQKAEYGVLSGPMQIFASDTDLSFDKVPRQLNKKAIYVKNTPNNTETYESFRGYEYTEKMTLVTDVSVSSDIELFGVEYYPNSDYLIVGDVYSGTQYQSTITLCIPKLRMRGVFDPTLQRTRAFIDGSYNDKFFGTVCDTLTGPIGTTFSFRIKDTIESDGSVRLYGQSSNPINMAGVLTSVSNPRVYVIGEDSVYSKIVESCTAKNILDAIAGGDFIDTLITPSGDSSKSNINVTYHYPIKLKPLSYKTSIIDDEGNIKQDFVNNSLNIFRVDGGFEPSYRDVLFYAATESPILTRQKLNSFAGKNTNIVGVSEIPIWFRRVSRTPIDSASVIINGERINLDIAVGRKLTYPVEDTWGDSFYSQALDIHIDSPVSGMEYMQDDRFFLSSKVSNIPTFLYYHDFTVGEIGSNSPVEYLKTDSSITIQLNIKRIIAEKLFSAGVYEFFESISPNIGTYLATKRYIDSNLIDAFRIKSVEIYSKPSDITVINSAEMPPETLSGYTKTDEFEVGQDSDDIKVITMSLDGNRELCLGLNIIRI